MTYKLHGLDINEQAIYLDWLVYDLLVSISGT